MTARYLILLAALAGLAAGEAHAQLFKCVGKDGAVTYQQSPCPVAAGEKRINAPAPGPEGAPTTPKADTSPKAGWDAETTQKMRSDCVTSALAGYKKSDKAGEFTDEQSRAIYEGYCGCIVRRAMAMSREEFLAKRAEHMARFASEAQKGGECAPDFARQPQ